MASLALLIIIQCQERVALSACDSRERTLGSMALDGGAAPSLPPFTRKMNTSHHTISMNLKIKYISDIPGSFLKIFFS